MAAGATGFANRFATFEGVAYLDAASQGPLPLAASRAGREALLLKERPYRISSATYVSASRRYARSLHASSERARSRWRSSPAPARW